MSVIAFPRALPDELPILGMTFKRQPMQEVTPLRSGKQIVKNLGPTLWYARWQSDRMTPDESGPVRAWCDTIEENGEQFYGYDKLREYPLAYALGWGGLTVDGQPFSGDGTLSNVALNNVEVSLADLPAGFVLSPGDYLAFDYSTSLRALHRCSAAATANGAGALTVEVRPHVRPGWAADAVVHLHRAAARMVMLPGTLDDREEAPHFVTTAFEAIQSL
jgi:ferric-dicitrate binding protein FerR (iron transport regulator)